MTNPEYDYDNTDIIPYDDAFDAEDFVEELMAEGYSREEAIRMAGDYDPEEYYEQDDDIPEMEDFDAEDFVDEEDFD